MPQTVDDHMRQTIAEQHDKIVMLKVKNDELLDLLAELYVCSEQTGCGRCHYREGCAVLNRMRHLGIEVEL